MIGGNEWAEQMMDERTREEGKQDKRKKVITFGLEWKDRDEIEMIERMLCARYDIVNRDEDCNTEMKAMQGVVKD